MNNIFYGKPVPPDSFVSRGNCDSSIERLIHEGRNIELIGPNRTGKTALCRFLASKLEKNSSAHVCFIDLLHLKVPRIGSVATKITGECIDEKIDEELDEFIGANQMAVHALIEYSQSILGKLVIIIDEMDAGLQRKGIYHEWNASLRMLDSQMFEKGIDNISFVRVLTSHPDYYENIHMGHVISKSIGGGYVIDMPSLTTEKAKELFESLLTSHSEIDSDFAIRYAGTFPFLLECLAYEARRLSDHGSNFKVVLEHVYRQSSPFYKGLFEFLERKDNHWKSLASMLIAVALIQAKAYTGPAVSSNDGKFNLDEMERGELIKLGVLKEGNGEEIFSPLFAWWISRHAVTILQEDNELSKRLISYFGAGDLKTLLTNIRSAQAVAGGLAALL